MAKNNYAEWTDEKLKKQQGLLKAILISFSIFYAIMIGFIIYIFATKGLEKVSFAAIIPIFIFPITITPLVISLGLINKEVTTRKQ